jgi:DNA-binding MarR family transcriptional regulator
MEVKEPTNFQSVNPNCSCFNLRKASRVITQFYDHCLAPAGIRITQFSLLISMAAEPTQTLTQLANNLVMDRTTLTRNLKPLERTGLIHSIEAKDRRSKAYTLTDQGMQVLKAAMPLWQNAQKKITVVLGDERFRFILKELNVLTNMMTVT